MGFLGKKSDLFCGRFLTRRDCLRYLMHGWGLLLAMPFSLARAAEVVSGIYKITLEGHGAGFINHLGY
jgi:hypothetical protein